MSWKVIASEGEKFEREIHNDLSKEPKQFFKKVLKVKTLTPDQEKIALSVFKKRFTAVKAAHGVGKTFIEACIAIWFLMTYKNSIVISTAPTERQVRDLLWSEINSLISNSKTSIGGKKKITGFMLEPRWFATGISTVAGREEESAVKFQGYHAKHILVIIDEAVGILPGIWEAIDGITNSDNAKILAVGNPATPNCEFKKRIDSGSYNVITVKAIDHPNIKLKKEIIPGAVSYHWVKDKLKKWCKKSSVSSESKGLFEFERKWYIPNNLFLWKVLGEFPEENSDSLISITKVRESIKRFTDNPKREIKYSNTIINTSRVHNRFISIDTARFGSDNSAIAILEDNYISHKTFYHLDIAKLTGEAINLIKKYKPAKVGVDCDGLGAGVYDNLNEAVSADIINTELVEIHGGANPIDMGESNRDEEEFLNLRAQMYWLLKQDIEEIAIEPGEELEEGLSSIKYFFNSKGKIQIESKDDIRRRLGRSPDIEDAIAYVNFLKYSAASGYSITEIKEDVPAFRKITEKIGI